MGPRHALQRGVEWLIRQCAMSPSFVALGVFAALLVLSPGASPLAPGANRGQHSTQQRLPVDRVLPRRLLEANTDPLNGDVRETIEIVETVVSRDASQPAEQVPVDTGGDVDAIPPPAPVETVPKDAASSIMSAPPVPTVDIVLFTNRAFAPGAAAVILGARRFSSLPVRAFIGYEGAPAELEAALRCLGVDMADVVVRPSALLVPREVTVRGFCCVGMCIARADTPVLHVVVRLQAARKGAPLARLHTSASNFARFTVLDTFPELAGGSHGEGVAWGGGLKEPRCIRLIQRSTCCAAPHASWQRRNSDSVILSVSLSVSLSCNRRHRLSRRVVP